MKKCVKNSQEASETLTKRSSSSRYQIKINVTRKR